MRGKFVKEEATTVQREPEQRNGLLFRNRDYTGWWIGDTFSDFGTALSFVAYPLLVLAVTGSVAGAGIVEAAGVIGSLVTMLFGGALADRFPRPAIMIVGPLVQAVAVGTVVVAITTDQVTVGYLAVVGFVQGMANGITQGAQLAAMRRLVPGEQMSAAWSLYIARSMSIKMVGPAVGGFLFSIMRWVPFLCDALSFLGSVIGTLLIRRPLGPDRDETGPRESIFASIGAGLRFIRGNAYLRFSAIWVSLVASSYAGLALLVILLVHSRGGSAALIGAVTAVGAIGGLAGALLSNRIAKRLPGRLLVITVSWTVVNVIVVTRTMEITPDELTGRVQSAMGVAATSIRWVGPISAGLLASAFSPAAAAIVFACVMAVLAIATHFSSGIRELDRPVAAPVG
jgi:MFS family permease